MLESVAAVLRPAFLSLCERYADRNCVICCPQAHCWDLNHTLSVNSRPFRHSCSDRRAVRRIASSMSLSNTWILQN